MSALSRDGRTVRATLPDGAPPVGSRQARWMLVLLTAAMGVNQLDRGIVAILLQSIKAEMRLSDTELGLLTGFGFSIVYAIASIPIGRLADRYSRVTIISTGMVVYSIMAALMGFATNLGQLIAARSAVAIGEATGSAPSSAIIADYFPPRTRARALGIWASGTYIGLFVGLIAGGWLNLHYGWRAALQVLALPGILLAILLRFTATEPEGGPASGPVVGIVAATAGLLGDRRYVCVLAAIVCSSFVNYAFSAWVPSFLARVHHLDAARVGLAAGFFKGFLGLGGSLLGGFAAHHLAGGRFRTMGRLAAISSALIMPAMLVFLFASSPSVSLTGLGVGSFLIPACQAPAFAMVQEVVAPGRRAYAMTLIFTCSSLIGLGLGPLVTGLISDASATGEGARSLASGLLLPTLVSLLAAAFFVGATRMREPAR